MILGHKQAGIELDGTVSKSNLVQANILTDNLIGVFIRDAQNNTIGGSKPSQGNTITDDHTTVAAKIAQSGVYIFDVNSTGNVVVGNTIKGMKYYGVLFFNTPLNANTNLEVGNQVRAAAPPTSGSIAERARRRETRRPQADDEEPPHQAGRSPSPGAPASREVPLNIPEQRTSASLTTIAGALT